MIDHLNGEILSIYILIIIIIIMIVSEAVKAGRVCPFLIVQLFVVRNVSK